MTPVSPLFAGTSGKKRLGGKCLNPNAIRFRRHKGTASWWPAPRARPGGLHSCRGISDPPEMLNPAPGMAVTHAPGRARSRPEATMASCRRRTRR